MFTAQFACRFKRLSISALFKGLDACQQQEQDCSGAAMLLERPGSDDVCEVK